MSRIFVQTEKPVALDSPDHLHPVGTKNDNSANPAFNRKLYELIPVEHVRLLDLGCAGGRFVRTILDDGGFAVGIEGSDYSIIHQRAEWPALNGKNLFTADCTEPFWVVDSDYEGDDPALWPEIQQFNICTGWEFFEHIHRDKIEEVVRNIRHHLDEGFFIGSIAPDPDIQEGVDTGLHQTVEPKEWWLEKFLSLGCRWRPDLEHHFKDVMVRTHGFPMAWDFGDT